MKRKQRKALPNPFAHEVEAGISGLHHAINGLQHLVGFLKDQPRTLENQQPGRLDAARKELKRAIVWIESAKRTPESFRDD